MSDFSRFNSRLQEPPSSSLESGGMERGVYACVFIAWAGGFNLMKLQPEAVK